MSEAKKAASAAQIAARKAAGERLAKLAATRRRDGRGTRAQEQREAVRVHETEDETSWVQPTSLQAPKPRPGYVQRWIRAAVKGKDDATNVSRKWREGWKPRPADTVPASFELPAISGGRWNGCIMVEGMILCEMSVQRNNARKKFIRGQIDRKTAAIDADLDRTNKQNRSPAFGDIRKSDRTIPVREVRMQEEEEARE